MYITINNIKGEKRIDLSYSIQTFDSDKEIAVIRMLSDNVKYEILKLHAVMDPISDMKKTIPSGTYAGRQLLSMLEGIIELYQFEVDDQVTKTNKLKGITEITLNLDELNKSDNLKDGRPSNASINLTSYHPPRLTAGPLIFSVKIPTPGTAFQCKTPAPRSEEMKQNPHPQAYFA